MDLNTWDDIYLHYFKVSGLIPR